MKAGERAFKDRLLIAFRVKWELSKDVAAVEETAQLYINRYLNKAELVRSTVDRFISEVSRECAA